MQPRYIVVESITDNVANCELESGEMVNIPLSLLPEGVKEQDWILVTACGYCIDREKTEQQKEKNISLYQKLINRQKEKDSE